MSRVKYLVLVLVLALWLIYPIPVAAADPNTCLPNCYAYNEAPTAGDGTKPYPWLWDKAGDPAAASLRQSVKQAVQGKRNFGTLEVVDCNDAQPPKCTATVYTYTRTGAETSQFVEDVPVPDVGVRVPFPYVLGGGALLGILLVGGGIVLWRRARRPAP